MDFVRALYQGLLHREPDEAGLARWSEGLMTGLPLSEVVRSFAASEEFRRTALPTLYVEPGHYYSPIVNPEEARRFFAEFWANGIPAVLPGVHIDRAAMVATWHDLLGFFARAPFRDTVQAGYRYAFDNPSYSWGDGLVLHAMIRRYQPKRFIEIGSGWSSACTLDTIDQFLSGTCDLTFIDPYLNLFRAVAGEIPPHTKTLEAQVQSVPLEIFSELRANDILFINSSHVVKTGSDVCFELFQILPRLASGVLVHIHDMFWPFEYPSSWVIDENRSWNELYAVRAFLMHNDDWDIVMFNDYLAKNERAMVEKTWPDFLRNSGGALWIRRR